MRNHVVKRSVRDLVLRSNGRTPHKRKRSATQGEQSNVSCGRSSIYIVTTCRSETKVYRMQLLC
jgi:hypothetical protein